MHRSVNFDSFFKAVTNGKLVLTEIMTEIIYDSNLETKNLIFTDEDLPAKCSIRCESVPENHS